MKSHVFYTVYSDADELRRKLRNLADSELVVDGDQDVVVFAISESTRQLLDWPIDRLPAIGINGTSCVFAKPETIQ